MFPFFISAFVSSSFKGELQVKYKGPNDGHELWQPAPTSTPVAELSTKQRRRMKPPPWTDVQVQHTNTPKLRMYAYIQPPPEIKFKIFRDSIEFVNTTDPTTAKRRKPRGENSRKKKETAVVSRNQIRVSARLRWFIYFQGEKRWDVIVRPLQRQQQQSFQQI